MTNDDYRSEFEEHRKKINLDDESDKTPISTRAELHRKKRKPPKKSRLSMINITLALFTLIPIIIFVFVFFNINSSKDPSTTTAQNSQVKYETSGKKSGDKKDSQTVGDNEDKEKEEQKQADKKKEQAAKEKKEQAEKEKKEQAEKEKIDQAAKEKQEQAEKEKKDQAAKEKQEQAEKEKKDQVAKEKAEPKPEPRIHVVGPKETFYSISVIYYKSGKGVDKIKQANGITSNEIYIGQTLTIPD